MEKILIIEDSILQATALINILNMDYIVELAKNGYEGLEKAISFQPSLILLDIIMPQIDGFHVLTSLKENMITKDIPVILITILSNVGHEEKGLILGAVDYIIKPFNPSIVKARVNTHIKLYLYRKALEHLAWIDALTNIPNRHYYNDRYRLEWFHAMQAQTPISIALIDIDFFKQFNDKYGHAKGDDVLKLVAQTISEILEHTINFVARYGGEEFICLMPNTSKEQAKEIAFKICRQIESLQIPNENSPSGNVLTVSIGGVTVIPQTAETYETYFELTDTMLYRAKNKGRNTVVWLK